MPIKGLGAAKKLLSSTVNRIRGRLAPDTVYEICAIGEAYAMALTPTATSTLINSHFKRLQYRPSGVYGQVGFTAAYAAAVNAAKGTLLGTNTPRSPATDGYVWDPGGEPDFLRKGFERDGKADIEAAVRRGMKL